MLHLRSTLPSVSEGSSCPSSAASSLNSSKEPSGQAVAQILASLSSAASIEPPLANYVLDSSTSSSSSSTSCEEYTPSLSSSASSVSSVASLRISADSSPILDSTNHLSFLPLPQHVSQPSSHIQQRKTLATEMQQQMLSVQQLNSNVASPMRITARASLHRRHSASCSSSSSSTQTVPRSATALAARTNGAGSRVAKSSGCHLSASYQSTVAALVKNAGKRGSFVSSLVGKLLIF